MRGNGQTQKKSSPKASRPVKRNMQLFSEDLAELNELRGALRVSSVALAYRKICTPAVRQAILDHAQKRQAELASVPNPAA